MNLDEFKAWFAGYTERMGVAPSTPEWERIKKQIASTYNKPINIERGSHPYGDTWTGTNPYTNSNTLPYRYGEAKTAAGSAFDSSLRNDNVGHIL